jgi:hypothetical protein
MVSDGVTVSGSFVITSTTFIQLHLLADRVIIFVPSHP